MAALADDMKAEYYKVIILGDAGVGKTCLIMRYVLSTYNASIGSTIGLHHLSKKVTWQGKELFLNIYDTAGHDRFRKMLTPEFRRSADAIISCYDITNRESFYNAQRWIDDCADNDNTLLVLVGCKSDLENHRVISTEEGLQMATDLKIRHFEVSAKDNNNTEKVFTYIVSNLADTKQKTGQTITLNKEEAPKRNRWCRY